MKKKLIILGATIILTAGITSTLASGVLINADKQTYNQKDKQVNFDGNVKATYENISVKSPKAVLITGADEKPETAIFTNALAVKITPESRSEVKANIMKLSILNNTIQAEGNVKSLVLENKVPVATIKSDFQEYDMTNSLITATGNVSINYKDVSSQSNKARIQVDNAGKPRYVHLTGSVKIVRDSSTVNAASVIYNTVTDELIAQGATTSTTTLDDASKVIINANLQQYDKTTGTLLTSGQVKLFYKDYIANGPKALFLSDNKSSKPNKIILTGRSRIQETDKQVEANKIEITLNPKNFTAVGNVKTRFTQFQNTAKTPARKTKTNAKSNKKDKKNSPENDKRKDFYNINDVSTTNQDSDINSAENTENVQ